MWKKFKHWLIKKLGGFVAPTQEVVVNHYTKELNTLSTTLRIDNRTLYNYPEMVDSLYTCAIEKLAHELRKAQCIEKETCKDPNMDGVIIKLSIRAAQAINPLPPSIKDNEEEWEKMIAEDKNKEILSYGNYVREENGFIKEQIYPPYNNKNPAIDEYTYEKIESATNPLYKSYNNITNPLN